MGFFEYISQHWYAGAALVLLVILTVFVWIRAAISGKKRSEERTSGARGRPERRRRPASGRKARPARARKAR